MSRGPLRKVAVLIPTYNERDNLPLIIERVRAATPEVDIVVLDDNSPDGTGQVADQIAATDAQVHVVHRPGKQGLGAAYLEGFRWAKEHGYDAVVEMDADGSHRPEHLPAMLKAAEQADLVIGSRYVKGGSVVNWPASRKVISMGGNVYTKALMGMRVNDATAGYRVYRIDALDRMRLDDVESHGYCFQIDLTRRAVGAGLTVVEVPITFVEREIGDSKMNSDIVKEALAKITIWGVSHRLGQVGRGVRRVTRRGRPEWHRL